MQPPTSIHNHANHPQLPTTIHNHPQPSTTPPPATTIRNHPQPSTTTQKTTHNHQELPKKAKTFHIQLFYCTLDFNTETDVDFDSDMKQWYIYIVCV